MKMEPTRSSQTKVSDTANFFFLTPKMQLKKLVKSFVLRCQDVKDPPCGLHQKEALRHHNVVLTRVPRVWRFNMKSIPDTLVCIVNPTIIFGFFSNTTEIISI